MSSSSHSDEKRSAVLDDVQPVRLSIKDVDAAAELVGADDGVLDPAEAARIRRKIDLHILPLMCTLYWVQYMDKTTLGSSAILGLLTATHLTTNQYNWLGTIFYLSYLLFEYPQNIALQRLPVGKWMSINIFIWGVTMCTHAACTNFAGLFVVRFILGVCEGSITAGFMIVTSMFYTRTEQTVRVGYWFLMNGTAQIITGFIAFGTLHIKTTTLEPWQWLMIITGLITLVNAVLFWFFFPDSPANARFLTLEERAKAVQRIKENQTGIENKHFKKEQMIEAFLDPKTWLFALFSALSQVPNSLTNQLQLIVTSFGYTVLQTTLLGCVGGLFEIGTIWTGVEIAARVKNGRAYVATIYILPAILGVFLVSCLSWSNKVGLLFGVWLNIIAITAFVIALSWLSSVTAGHTKRITSNAIMLCAYCVGNAVGPFMWQERYKPRNRVPWIIIGICYVACMITLLLIRYVLATENKRRDAEPKDTRYDGVYVERVTADGVREKVRIDKEFLDLTDIENREFRYVL